jgi:hypothetical protein
MRGHLPLLLQQAGRMVIAKRGVGKSIFASCKQTEIAEDADRDYSGEIRS